jgi:hypothetical protein
MARARAVPRRPMRLFRLSWGAEPRSFRQGPSAFGAIGAITGLTLDHLAERPDVVVAWTGALDHA